MNENNHVDTAVYVDTAALASWSSQMSSINTAAIDNLNTFMSTVSELEGSFAGNSATAFLNSMNNFLKSAIASHESMSDVETFLKTVIITMESQ